MFTIKQGDDTVTKSLRMPRRLAQRMDRLAEENKVSFTDLVLQCLEYALNSMDSDAKETKKAMAQK